MTRVLSSNGIITHLKEGETILEWTARHERAVQTKILKEGLSDGS